MSSICNDSLDNESGDDTPKGNKKGLVLSISIEKKNQTRSV